MEETIEIYAAGASLGEPGPGGYAAVIDPDNQRHTVQGHEAQTNRERMEITAVLEALRVTNEISPPGGVKAIIHSRSHNLTEAFNQGLIAGWKRKEWRSSRGYPLKNQDLWKQILDTAGDLRITCVHLKNSSQSETAAESRRLAFKQANRTTEAPIDTKTAQAPIDTGAAEAPANTGAAEGPADTKGPDRPRNHAARTLHLFPVRQRDRRHHPSPVHGRRPSPAHGRTIRPAVHHH